MTTNPYALSTAQDDDEMFEVMVAPLADFDMSNDRPISTGNLKARKRVHKDQDWHRSVHIWLVDISQRKVAMQKRSMNKDTFPGRWDISAAGHIEAGGDSKETAVREVAEELGLTVKEDELVFGFTCPAEQAPWGGCNAYEDVYFLERDSQNCTFSIGAAEVTSVKWIDINELARLLNERNVDYVPRVDHYIRSFFQHLKTMCSKAHGEHKR